MTTYAVLATGESMNQALADSIRGHFHAVVVADAFRLAPWADALVCNDMRWWNVYPEALQFQGRKFCARFHPGMGVEMLPTTVEFPPGTNSGLQGMRVARALGATRILLLGFDMGGTHYFGPHPAPLRNTSPDRFREFVLQFDRWLGGCEVLNCTPGSALTKFPAASLDVLLTADAYGRRDRA